MNTISDLSPSKNQVKTIDHINNNLANNYISLSEENEFKKNSNKEANIKDKIENINIAKKFEEMKQKNNKEEKIDSKKSETIDETHKKDENQKSKESKEENEEKKIKNDAKEKDEKKVEIKPVKENNKKTFDMISKMFENNYTCILYFNILISIYLKHFIFCFNAIIIEFFLSNPIKKFIITVFKHIDIIF